VLIRNDTARIEGSWFGKGRSGVFGIGWTLVVTTQHVRERVDRYRYAHL